MSLSVCLLTRNQRERLTAALRSLAGAADEVLVVDAGSTDGTPEVAGAMRARLAPFRWDEDVAAGRNFALGRVRSDWVLWFGADEELLPDAAAALRACCATEGVDAFTVNVHNVLASG